jgi:hypothetical protein
MYDFPPTMTNGADFIGDQYMGSNCKGNTKPATLADNLMDHFHMTSLMWYHEYLSNYTVSQNSSYVIGETNSISVRVSLLHLTSPPLMDCRINKIILVPRPSWYFRCLRRCSLVHRLCSLRRYATRLTYLFPHGHALSLFPLATC